MARERIIAADRRGDATLGERGVAPGERQARAVTVAITRAFAAQPQGSRRHEHHLMPERCRLERARDAGDPGTEHEHHGFAASMRSSATRDSAATEPSTVMRFGTDPATSASRVHAR